MVTLLIRSIRSRSCAALLPLPAALVLFLSLCTVAAAQIVIGPVDPVPKLPGGGGQYHGPSDIVPPNLPPFDPHDPNTCPAQTQAVCSPGLLPATQCGSTSCPSLHFVEHSGSQCIHCQGDPDGEDGLCFSANGWDLTYGNARAFCHAPDPACLDANQSLTVCVSERSACEIHLFESSWINHDLFPNRPVCAPVATQACLDGTPIFSHPHAIDSHHQGTGACDSHTVCLTFNKDCFCNAVLGWENLLGTAPSFYDNQPLFHVGFTTCSTCDCPHAGMTPVEP